jgi:hypothetical protein
MHLRLTVHLERNTAVDRVLKEQTTVDLALVKVGLLETSVGNIRSTSGLLEYTHLVLAATLKVDSEGTSDLLEWGLAGRVEDGGFAIGLVSTTMINLY